jgi:hypothetical protein
MNRVVLCVLVLMGAMPAMAGTWDPNYVWESGKTVFGGYPDEDGSLYTSLAAWGLPLESPPKAIYGELSGTIGRPKAPDRLGRMNSQDGAELDWTSDQLGTDGKYGKIKWRFDHSTNPAGRVPPGGHSPDYSAGVASSIALGMMVCDGSNYLGYATGTGVPPSFVAGDAGNIRISLSGANGGLNLRWYNTPQTVNVTGGGTFSSNWAPNSATVTEATGNWLMPANTWADVQLIFNNDAAKTWDAYLVREGFATGHMKGLCSGSAGSSNQFGIVNATASQGVAYDYVAFGWGADHIQYIPEPASLILLGLGAIPLIRRRVIR